MVFYDVPCKLYHRNIATSYSLKINVNIFVISVGFEVHVFVAVKMELLDRIVDGYHDLMDNQSDPRVNDWFLMSSPFPTLAICLTYVFTVKVSEFFTFLKIYITSFQ